MKNINLSATLIRLPVDNSQAKVTTNDEVTKAINIEIGVRQGHALSTTLFNIVLDGVIKVTGIRKTIAQIAKQIVAYANDLALIARDKKI